jgi:hypothetical protein
MEDICDEFGRGCPVICLFKKAELLVEGARLRLLIRRLRYNRLVVVNIGDQDV